MDRRRGYGYGYAEPPQIDPNIIDFGQLQMYNPQDTERLAQVGQGMQQRWDTSQMAIAKYLEDIGAADMDAGIRDQVMGKLNADLENLYGKVQKDYQGDFGRGMHDIMKSLSSSRGLMHQAVQGTAQERQAREQYQQAAMQGKINHIFDPETGQRRMMTFEEVHGGKQNLLGFDEETGRITGGKYGTLRGAADITGYIAQNVTKALNARGTAGGLKNYDKNDVVGMLAYHETQGTSQREVDAFISQHADALVRQLKGEVTFLNEELSGLPVEQQAKVLLDYIKPIIKNQVAYQYAEKYMQAPKQVGNNDGGDSRYLPTYNRPLDINDNTNKINKTEQKTTEAVQTVSTLNKVVGALSQIDSVLGIDSSGRTPYKSFEYTPEGYFKEAQDRLNSGEGTVLDAINVWDNRLTLRATHVVDTLTHTINEITKETNLTNKPLHIVESEINKYIVPTAADNLELREQRQALLSLLWVDEEKRNKYGLVQTEEGIIDFKPSGEFGSRNISINEQRRINAIHNARKDIAGVIKGGYKGLDKQIKKEMDKVNKFFKENPLTSELAEFYKHELIAQGITDEGELTQKASTMAIETMSNTLKNNAAIFNKELSLSNLPENPTEKNTAFSLIGNRIRRYPDDKILQEFYKRNKNKKDDLKKAEAAVLFSDSNIDDITVIPSEGRISILLKNDKSRYEMDIESIAPADNIATIKKAKQFMSRVTGLEIYNKDKGGNADINSKTEDSINLGGQVFKHIYGIDPKTNMIVSTIVDSRGNPAEAEFMNAYTNYIYKMFQ